MRGSGLSHGIVRYANVYGPGQRADLEGGVVAIFADALETGRSVTIIGSGEQVRDLVYVEDAVLGALAIATTSRDGTWNVATGVATSIHALLRQLESLISPATAVHHEPERPGDVRSSVLSILRIREQLAWAPRYPVADGLRAFLRSM